MSEPAANDLLAHIREAANQAVAYIEGLVREDFLADKRTQQAVILNLVIIGEAAMYSLARSALQTWMLGPVTIMRSSPSARASTPIDTGPASNQEVW